VNLDPGRHPGVAGAEGQQTEYSGLSPLQAELGLLWRLRRGSVEVPRCTGYLEEITLMPLPLLGEMDGATSAESIPAPHAAAGRPAVLDAARL
jgi:hypothetical protein